MTISNRVSLALAAGFLLLAIASGMGASAARFHPVNLVLATIGVDVVLLMAGIKTRANHAAGMRTCVSTSAAGYPISRVDFAGLSFSVYVHAVCQIVSGAKPVR